MSWSLRRGKDGGAVDRCALFVDAGYVLADGAMAVHGTRRAESVSWDYEGLLQLLSSLARERSGLPVLRCYWYEATVDGRRTAEQDALADVPGIKLRIAKIRPGRREGVETEIHRDLTTLARNNAISDALVVSAEEDLAQVIADVQDLGMRVTLVHIAVDGNWTISRALRQESDDIIEISGDHLRPYVELVAGAEPAHLDEGGDLAAVRPLANGHSTAPAASYQQAPAARGTTRPPPSTPRRSWPNTSGPRCSCPGRRRGTTGPGTTGPGRRPGARGADHAGRQRRRAVRRPPGHPVPPGHPIPPGHRHPGQDIPPARTSRHPAGHHVPAGHLHRAGRQHAQPARTGPARPAEPRRARPRRRGTRGLRAARRAGSPVPPGAPVPQAPQGTPEPAPGPDATQPAPSQLPSQLPGQLRRLPSARTPVQPGPARRQGRARIRPEPGPARLQGQQARSRARARTRTRPAAPPTAARSRW